MDKRHFRNRVDAGKLLGQLLITYQDHPNLVVLGMPRGGVPVASEIAATLRAPMDIFVSRLVPVPGGTGTVGIAASGGIFLKDPIHPLPAELSDLAVAANVAEELREVARRERRWRGELPPITLEGKTVILADDGLAPRDLFRLTLQAVRQHRPSSLIGAVPMAPQHAIADWSGNADEIVCAVPLEPLFEVGMWYQDFSHTATDAQIYASLKNAVPSLHAA